jgi:peptidyl-prolyl cis-trans isomerase SurA
MTYIKTSLTVVLLFLAGIMTAQGQPKKAVADKIIAVVGDRIILFSDIKNSLADISRNGSNLPENAACLITEQAIVSKVLMLQAEKDSLPVTEEEVEAELDQRIRYYISQLGTQEALEEMAGQTIYQIKENARESVKERKLAEAMQQKIVSSIKITPTEVKAFFDRIPKDSLQFFESELEIGQIIIYPKASRDLEQYIVTEMNNYKKQLENKTAAFEALAKRFGEGEEENIRGREFQINRNEKNWDPIFLSTAFRLKNGEISAPVKSKFGYHLIQMVQRNGDDAIVKHILRIPPVTDAEISQVKSKLDTVRSKILSNSVGFNEAALKYSDEDVVKFNGAFILNRVGEISQPVVFTDERNKKGVRLVFFKSRSEPHRMNLRDDYSKISQMALEEKKGQTIDKWLKAKIPTYYIMVDSNTAGDCPNVQKFASADPKGY